MEYNKKINTKLHELNKYFDIKIYAKSENAIVTFFVYENITIDLKNILDLFINTNLKFNKESTIYIFTNHIELKKYYQNDKIIFLFFPNVDNEIMTNRVIFNYYAIKLFSSYNQLFLFDTDLIPIKSYRDIFKSNYDIGLTISNDWSKYNKFPINAGFLVCNNINQKQIKNFRELYLRSYQKTLSLEKQILKLKLISHKKISLSEWWGDQYLFFVMFEFKLPNGIKNYFDVSKYNINFRFFNEWNYNHQSADLKYISFDFNIDKYMKKISDILFIHLKGNRKKLANQFSNILIK